jgi:hypothetical protein
MTTAILLRITSVISFLLAAGHTLGGWSSWSPVGDTEVLTSMRTFQFQTVGVTRSYLDFYRGFGFDLSVFFVLQAVVLWQLAIMAKTNPRPLKPIIASFTVASIALGILAWEYLFPVPVAFCLAISAGLGLALYAGR